MSKTIIETYGMAPVAAYQVRKLLTEPEIGTDPALVYGVELEIERLSGLRASHAVNGMQYYDDGSLRNNGGEFVTNPCKMRELSYVLNTFFMKNKFTEENYSERCSTHVHINVQDFTYDNIMSLCLLYQLYERVLFAYIGNERSANIFCVPWYDTIMVSMLDEETLNGFLGQARGWQKYTALNLLPMQTQGTVEFRHMAGTHDVARILEWCNIIGCLTSYARKTPLETLKQEIISLNTSSRYAGFFAEVFGQYAEVLKSSTNFELAMEDGVIQCKRGLSHLLSQKKSEKKERKSAHLTSFEAREIAWFAQQFADQDSDIERSPRGPRIVPGLGDRPITEDIPIVNAIFAGHPPVFNEAS